MARILIVDDAMIMRIKIREILEEQGHEVVAEAANGDTAYKEYCKHMPDLVTMDLTMPEYNGLEAVERIMKEFPKAVIIMVSAITQKDLIFQAIRLGAKGFIIKPFEKEKLIEAINKALKIEPSASKPAGQRIMNTYTRANQLNNLNSTIAKINSSISSISKSIDKLDRENKK